jgi:hypothetical protein
MLGHRDRFERAIAIPRHRSSTSPISVITVLGDDPLREFPEPRPAASYGS